MPHNHHHSIVVPPHSISSGKGIRGKVVLSVRFINVSCQMNIVDYFMSEKFH